MRSLFIENEYFDLKNSKSKYLISSLKILCNSGFSIYLSKTVLDNGEWLRNLLKQEGIKYKVTSNKEDKLIIGNGYKNLNDTVKKLCSNRHSEIKRKTKETEILVKLNLDGDGKAKISTGIAFFDHMLDQIARHANCDLELIVKGDLTVDEHHTIEDTGLVLGEAIHKALGNKKGIQRYGFLIPMDESSAICSIDLSGRSCLNYSCEFKREMVGAFPTELTEEFFRALSTGMKANIYIKARGKNDHHKIESIFKAFAKSLNEACRMDERNKNTLPSTKGLL